MTVLGGNQDCSFEKRKGDDDMAKPMTTSTMTDPQIERAVEIFRAGLRAHAKDLPSNAVQLAFGNKELPKEWAGILRKHAEATMLLAPRGVTTLTLAEDHDPGTFFQTRQGLWVYNDFRSRIVEKANPMTAGSTFKIRYSELMKDAADEAIETALQSDHLFEESQVCPVIATLIAKQPNGEEGVLINNGYANLFYTGSSVVYVYWSAGVREWRVDTYGRVDHEWRAGNRAFSPAN